MSAGDKILAMKPAVASAPGIWPELLADLRRDEGCRLSAYPDPLTRGAPWTIGVGHCGPEVHEGLVWTQAQADAALISDVQEAMRQLDAQLPWWRGLDAVRSQALVNMAFNLGVARLLGFTTMLAALKAKDWRKAADAALKSRWSVQVGARATRIAQMFASGERP